MKPKVHVFSNLAISLDGKIAPKGGGLHPLGTPYDREMMSVIRKRSQAIIFGASTLRSFKRPCKIKNAKKHPINVVISSSLEGFSAQWPFFKDPTLKRILFVSKKTPSHKIKTFKSSCQIILIKDPKKTAKEVISVLQKMGLSRLLIEGGGGIMWEFVKNNLIDELYVTLTPKIVGGKEAPTLVDGEGFSPNHVISLKLHEVRKVGDEIYLRYLRLKKRN